MELPDDYEECGTCGFDHEYASREARMEHLRLEVQEADDERAMMAGALSSLPVTDGELGQQADCGCVYHAEDGIPCPHDLELAYRRGKITDVDLQERMHRLHPNWPWHSRLDGPMPPLAGSDGRVPVEERTP